eukprot:m51a1_g4484 hypothetical protein (276) ;mRNA; r:278203-279713
MANNPERALTNEAPSTACFIKLCALVPLGVEVQGSTVLIGASPPKRFVFDAVFPQAEASEVFERLMCEPLSAMPASVGGALVAVGAAGTTATAMAASRRAVELLVARTAEQGTTLAVACFEISGSAVKVALRDLGAEPPCPFDEGASAIAGAVARREPGAGLAMLVQLRVGHKGKDAESKPPKALSRFAVVDLPISTHEKSVTAVMSILRDLKRLQFSDEEQVARLPFGDSLLTNALREPLCGPLGVVAIAHVDEVADQNKQTLGTFEGLIPADY